MDLARSYLSLLAAQPGRPLALFAPRRVGKTFFLDHDLAPEANKSGLLSVYADLWLHKTSPLFAVNHALEEALDDLLVPASNVGKMGKADAVKFAIGNLPKTKWLPKQMRVTGYDGPARKAKPAKKIVKAAKKAKR